MKKLLFSLILSTACSNSPTTPTPDTTTCAWRDGWMKSWLATACPKGQLACVADHTIPVFLTLPNGEIEWVYDSGIGIKWEDRPKWCK